LCFFDLQVSSYYQRTAIYQLHLNFLSTLSITGFLAA
jgi:hypothetical protein